MYNYLTIVGNLTRNPESHLTKDKKIYVRFTLASNYKKDTPPIYMDVVIFGKLCEVASEYLRKGSKCLVGGRLESNVWEDDTGKKRTSLMLIAFSLECLDPKEVSSAPLETADDKLPF